MPKRISLKGMSKRHRAAVMAQSPEGATMKNKGITLADLPADWRNQAIEKLKLPRMQPEPKAKQAAEPRGMNKIEESYACHLEMLLRAGELRSWKFESVKLVIATGKKKAWFKVDFHVVTRDGKHEFHETKGWWREAARLRIKVAAGLYPWARFVGVQRVEGQWVYEEFGA